MNVSVGEVSMQKFAYKIVIIISIQLVIAAIHIFRLGQIFEGNLYNLYYSYFSDLILPFGIYFLLSANEYSIPFLRHWRVKALAVFSLATLAEILQYFGVYALGVTFDPIDILMYGCGVILAAIVDTQVFSRLFKFWKFENPRLVKSNRL